MSTEPNTETPHASAGPQRTCVGCRQVDEQKTLVRVTLSANELRVDNQERSAKRSPGRGAYVHRRTECLTKAEKGGFNRSFRKSVGRVTSIRALVLLDEQSEGCK